MSGAAADRYARQLQDVVGLPSPPRLFWKGRVALYAILRAMGIGAGDEVILPALTCIVVPSAVKYVGARPVYVDIDPWTFNIDVAQIASKLTSRTRAILAQNTFGLAADLDPICAIARAHGLRVIEDCAHGFGGTYKGRPNGTTADAAFFSTQWNKPFSTGIGGFAVTIDSSLAIALARSQVDAVAPSALETLLLRLQLFANDHLLTETTYWTALALYRFLSRHNGVVGSSQGGELERPDMPAGFFKAMSAVQARRGARELGSLAANLGHRANLAAIYSDALTSLGVAPPYQPPYATHTYVKFPLLVRDRERFIADAQAQHIEVGDWFVSPLHPLVDNYAAWDYHYGANPTAERVSRHLVNLHTHRRITEQQARRVCEFLSERRANLFSSVEECLHGSLSKNVISPLGLVGNPFAVRSA
jgi:perosamine synthetase